MAKIIREVKVGRSTFFFSFFEVLSFRFSSRSVIYIEAASLKARFFLRFRLRRTSVNDPRSACRRFFWVRPCMSPHSTMQGVDVLASPSPCALVGGWHPWGSHPWNIACGLLWGAQAHNRDSLGQCSSHVEAACSTSAPEPGSRYSIDALALLLRQGCRSSRRSIKSSQSATPSSSKMECRVPGKQQIVAA